MKLNQKSYSSSTKAKKNRLTTLNEKEKSLAKRIRKTRIPKDDFKELRISKALAMSGVGSRRYCDTLIEAKSVTINGKLAKLGQTITFQDRIQVNSNIIKIKWPDRLIRIIVYHKLEGELVTRNDKENRPSVFDKISILKNKRFISIGRLDFNTSGLLIFTNSGSLTNYFTHPRYEVERKYSVRIYGKELTHSQIIELKTGIKLEDGIAKFLDIVKIPNTNLDSKNHWYNVIITEGRNREVRRMFEYFGATISRLIRIGFGPIALPPRLKRGQYYELNELEVAEIIKKLGLNISGTCDSKTERKINVNKVR